MAKFLRRSLACILALSAGACAFSAYGAESYDPLQPPAELLSPVEGGSAVSQELVLQSVLISSQRRVAVISGQTVSVGQYVNGYRLVALTARQAQLQGPQGRLLLWLLPASNGKDAARPAEKMQASIDSNETPRVSQKAAQPSGERK